MTETEFMEYVHNPGKITIIQKSSEIEIPVRKRLTFVEKITQEGYLLAFEHAYDRLYINFLAGVDNETTLREFRERIEELENELR